MADEEIDILGDFKLELDAPCFGSSELGTQANDLLHGDLSHPWLLENNTPWYLDQVMDERSRTAIEKMLHEERLLGVPSVSSASTFNATDTTSATDHIDKWSLKDGQIIDMTGLELFDDTEIPTSVEEVITAVTTGQTTVPNQGDNLKRRKRNNSDKLKNRKKTVLNGANKRNQVKKIKTIPKKTVETVTRPLTVRIVSQGEQIIRIQKQRLDSDSDTEISIEDDESPRPIDCIDASEIKPDTDEESEDDHEPEDPLQSEKGLGGREFRISNHQEIMDLILQLPPPESEVTLHPAKIQEQEQEIHFEFFDGRPTKTAERYLKIRNHIIECWQRSRPQYVTKTSVRTGLKNCGDVNCIGRIHAFLEQTGAINFGCEQAQYRRPYVTSIPVPKEKTHPEPVIHHQRIDGMRPRKKKPPVDLADSTLGGVTIEHNDTGEVIETTKVKQSKPRAKKDTSENPFTLVHCSEFGLDKQAPFIVHCELSALIVIDIHTHSCFTEVIGLLGGRFDKATGCLRIVAAEPCKSVSTGIQCEMCPVSQLEAAQFLHSKHLHVVGWYHSHPTFAPNPSVRDLETQQKFQDWFANTDDYSPFVGMIASPYFSVASLASQYRCLVVQRENNIDVPYKFKVTLINTRRLMDEVTACTKKIIKSLHKCTSIVPFSEPYRPRAELSYLDKMLDSIHAHSSCIIAADVSAHLLQEIKKLFAEFLDSEDM